MKKKQKLDSIVDEIRSCGIKHVCRNDLIEIAIDRLILIAHELEN